MGIRAIAVRNGTYARFRIVPRAVQSYRPETRRDRPSARVVSLQAYRSRPGLWTRLLDDRQVVGLKVVLLSLVVLLALALEVPL